MQFLGSVDDVPLIATTGAWSDSAQSRAGAAVAFPEVVDIPVVAQLQIPLVLLT